MFNFGLISGDVFCLVLTIILLRYQAQRSKSTVQNLYKTALYIWCAYLVCLVVLKVLNVVQGPVVRPLKYIINILFTFSAANLGYIWFWFFVLSYGGESFYSSKTHYITAVPALILVIAAMISPLNGCLFALDANNMYVHGPLYVLNFLGSYSYMLITTLWTVYLIAKSKSRLEAKRNMQILLYGLYPILTGIIQAINGNIHIECYGITLTMISVYLTLQEEKITVDALTQLNNRYRLESYLQNKTKQYQEVTVNSKSLFYIMLDINKFKIINDKFGHLEGDHALKCVSQVLSRMANTHQYFLARYGGDEFSIIVERYSINEVKELCAEIKENVKAANTNPYYELTVSAGCSQYQGSKMSVYEWIEEADKNLYKDKNESKN